MSGFPERLREERNRLGLTQEQLGEVGGVKKQAQSLYEGGKRNPDVGYLDRVSAVGVDVVYLLTGVRSGDGQYPKGAVTTTLKTGGEITNVYRLDESDQLQWRDVLIIAIDELQAAGLSLPGEKLAEVVDLLVEFQKHGLATTREAIRKQIRLVA